MKKKMEFSKLILAVFGVVEVGVILFTCYMVYVTQDLSPLAYLIPSTAIVGTAGVKHYYQKASTENRIKLMKAYNVEPTESAFSENF